MKGWRVFGLALLMVCVIAFPSSSAPGVPQEREAVLQELFGLNRRLEESRRALVGLEEQLQQAVDRQGEAQLRRDQLDVRLTAKRQLYGKRLRYYRERGNAPPYALLLRSVSFRDFLWRLDVLEQIMAQDQRLVRELRELQLAAAEEERILAEALLEAQTVRQAQVTEIAQLERAIGEREAILAGLGEERPEVEQVLAIVEEDWTERAQPVMEALGLALQELGTTEFEPDETRMTLLPPGAEVKISEERLNQFFRGWPELEGLEVRLPPGEFHLVGAFQQVPIRIEGGLQVLPDGRLRYVPTLMEVREFRVPQATIDEILALEQLDIDLSELIQPLVLKRIQVTKGMVTIRAGMR